MVSYVKIETVEGSNIIEGYIEFEVKVNSIKLDLENAIKVTIVK